MAIRVLFVDDDSNVLSGLKRMLMLHGRDLVASFAEDGASALRLLEHNPQDVVVSDMRMPRMDGAQFLTEVRARHPGTIRIVLSGHSEQELVMRSLGPTHQYLTKPCDAEVLLETIRQAFALQSLLSDERTRRLTGRLRNVPSLPSSLQELMAEIQKPGCTAARIGEIVSRDAGLTAQMLRIVNSSYFGLRREIANPEEAVRYLGLNLVIGLATTAHVFEQVDDETRRWADVDAVWKHGLTTGIMAKAIALMETNDRGVIDEAFAGGILHDAGRLILAANIPEDYRKVMAAQRADGSPLHSVEAAMLGTTHAEIGAYVIGLWGLPKALIEALAYHHAPANCLDGRFSPLTAVHAACAFEHQMSGKADSPGPNEDYLDRIGMAGRAPLWREACMEAFEKMHEVES